MKPKWQRARFIANVESRFLGQTLFVKCERPTLRDIAAPPDEGEPAIPTTDKPQLGLDSNVLWAPGRLMGIFMEDVELLPDFAEDVPLVPWDQFLADCRKES